MRKTASAFALFAVGIASSAVPAHAHLMPKQQGTLNIRDSAAFGAFSIPVSALNGWDDNRDGRISGSELTRHRAAIDVQLNAGIRIRTGADDGRRDLLLANVELDEADALATRGGTHLLVLVRQSFGAAPESLRLAITLFGVRDDENKFIIKATTPNASPEMAILSRTHAHHNFFTPLPVQLVQWPDLSRQVAAVLTLLLAVVLVKVRTGRRLRVTT